MYPFNDDSVTEHVHLSNVTGVRSKGQIACLSSDKWCVILNEPIDTMKDCPLYMGTDIKTARFRVCKFIRCVRYLHRTILIVLESWHAKSKDGSRNSNFKLLSFSFLSKELFIEQDLKKISKILEATDYHIFWLGKF